MENYDAIIIGASTENPYFTLTNGIRSRSFLFEFKSLSNNELEILLKKAIKILDIEIEESAKNYLITSSNGDARAMLNLIDFCAKTTDTITTTVLKELRPHPLVDGVSSNDSHYDLASAMIKSIRGSDIDAALYYLARLIEAGESVEFISRRLVIHASEDIGNANPHALNIANSTMQSALKIGFPEARILLGQCIIYLTSSPKSNSSYMAINKALNYVQNEKELKIPKHIKDSAIGYKYPHDFGGYVEQEYLEKKLIFYEAKGIGFEKTLQEWSDKIKRKNML
jgi:putative ATPase